MYEEKEIEGMKNTEEKQLMMILKESGKPYVKKHDGYATKVEEDKQIEYKDWEGNERTLKVPAGSYIIAEGSSCYPKVVTAEDFEKKYKFMEEKQEKPVVGSQVKIGIEGLV